MLGYSDNDAWGNLVKISSWRFRKAIHLEGKEAIDIPVIDWAMNPPKLIGTQAYVVNASYTPTKNSIYIPLGYIQPTFIDLQERGIEYNLAHIGYTLGHEMSHCLDDTGSKYDYKGNLDNWWTAHDRKIFNNKVKDVVKQYETFAAYDGIKMDASLSTGENLADISGLEICEEYLRDFQYYNKDIAPISSLGFQSFFVYIAQQARQKIYDKAVKAQLKTNPHPMNKYRTNCPLTRLKLFQSVYNIKKGDKMYWDPTNIW
jgi:putative endopeptidase